MTISQFQNRSAWLYLLPVGLVLAVPAFLRGAADSGDERKTAFLLGMGVIAGILWMLAKAFRVCVIHYPEAAVVQWQYRLFGAQYASKEVPANQILAIGLRYWRTKYVHYEPVAALANGKMLAIGQVESAYSLTGENDQSPFQAARRQAESAAKLLGVQCLASDPDVSMQILGGQAVAAPNSRQSQMNLNRWALLLTMGAGLAALLFAFMRG